MSFRILSYWTHAYLIFNPVFIIIFIGVNPACFIEIPSEKRVESLLLSYCHVPVCLSELFPFQSVAIVHPLRYLVLERTLTYT